MSRDDDARHNPGRIASATAALKPLIPQREPPRDVSLSPLVEELDDERRRRPTALEIYRANDAAGSTPEVGFGNTTTYRLQTRSLPFVEAPHRFSQPGYAYDVMMSLG